MHGWPNQSSQKYSYYNAAQHTSQWLYVTGWVSRSDRVFPILVNQCGSELWTTNNCVSSCIATLIQFNILNVVIAQKFEFNNINSTSVKCTTEKWTSYWRTASSQRSYWHKLKPQYKWRPVCWTTPCTTPARGSAGRAWSRAPVTRPSGWWPPGALQGRRSAAPALSPATCPCSSTRGTSGVWRRVLQFWHWYCDENTIIRDGASTRQRH